MRVTQNLRIITPRQDQIKKIASFKDVESFRAHLEFLELDLPLDGEILTASNGSPLSNAFYIGDFKVGNRWCIQPMEGWDGTPDGKPTELVERRWQNFGKSGAKLIWGGEAFAVEFEGRANPRQLYYSKGNREPMRKLLELLIETHRRNFGTTDDLLVGLQLTHSGRFCKPNDNKKFEPRIAYHHPLLDKKFSINPSDDSIVLTDDDIKYMIENYISAAKMAQDIGFHFVDVKACHGYLGHEFLSAFDRKGSFGGDFEGRTKFIRDIIQGIKSECPQLLIGVRLSTFDSPPYKPDPNKSSKGNLGPGIPEDFTTCLPYPGFGLNREDPLEIDLTEPIKLLKMLHEQLEVSIVNLTCGSPYYNPHIQRPAIFPPSDGYQPPEDPLIGVARQIDVVREIKEQIPDLPIVGTAYTYFQEYLPHVAQAIIRSNIATFIGIGRLVLSYPELPRDCLEKGTVDKKRICRTFSDCTTAPRNGLASGCYPLDPHYKNSEAFVALREIKDSTKDKLSK